MCCISSVNVCSADEIWSWGLKIGAASCFCMCTATQSPFEITWIKPFESTWLHQANHTNQANQPKQSNLPSALSWSFNHYFPESRSAEVGIKPLDWLDGLVRLVWSAGFGGLDLFRCYDANRSNQPNPAKPTKPTNPSNQTNQSN